MQTVTLDDASQNLVLTIDDPPPIIYAQDPIIQNVIIAINQVISSGLSVSTVAFKHFDVLLQGLYSHRIIVTLTDARTATMKFTQIDPIEIFDFALGGVWSLLEFNLLPSIKGPILDCHRNHHTLTTDWTKK